MVMYNITSKLNSTFRTLGKATADKITARLVGENASFRFSVKNFEQLFASGSVNIVDYSTIFTEPEANNCFSIISELNNRA